MPTYERVAEESLICMKRSHRDMETALRLIADTDPVDAALDPDRAIRVARQALSQLDGTRRRAPV